MANEIVSYINRLRQNNHLYIIVFFMMLVSDDSFLFGASEINTLTNVKFSFIAVMPLLVYFFSSKVRLMGGRETMVAFLICLLLMISSLVNSLKLFGGSIIAVLLVLSGFMFVKKIQFNRFCQCFSDIVTFIIAYSLIIFIVIQGGLVSPSSISNIGGHEFRTLGGCLYSFNGTFYRNSAFFREAGMFMIYINMALLFDILTKDNISEKKIAFYGLGVLSTFSTGGIIAYLILLALYVMKESKSSNKVIVLVFTVIAVYFAIGYEDLMDTFFGKLQDGLDNRSTLNRYATMVVPFYIMMNNPLFGCGFENYADMFRQHSSTALGFFVNESGSTNTIMSSGAIWGVWMTFFWVVSLWLFSRKYGKKVFVQSVMIFLVLFVLFSNEVRYFSVFSYIIAFYGIQSHYSLTRLKR